MEQLTSYHLQLGGSQEVVVFRSGRGWRVYWEARGLLARLTVDGKIGQRLIGWTAGEVQTIEALLHAQTERPWLVPVQP